MAFINRTFLLTIWFLQLSAVAGLAVQDNLQDILIDRMQQRYHDLQSISFSFTQITTSGHRERLGKGRALFFRPAFMRPRAVIRWDYSQPEPQVIINDGSTLSIYSAAEHQLIITPASEMESDVTYGLLVGRNKVTDNFRLLAPDPMFSLGTAEPDLTAIRLQPRKPQPQISMVQLWLDKTGIIHHILLQDYFDSTTWLHFTDIKLNPITGDERSAYKRIIHLDLPPDTEIIHQ